MTQYALLAALALLLAATCIEPPYPDYLLLQQVPTVAVLLLFPFLAKRFRLGLFSFSLVVGFLALHIVGARYLYSYVPYDDWCRAVAGFAPSEAFGFKRNHYDRLVHFCYGLMLFRPFFEVVRRRAGGSASAALSTVGWIVATSALYEIFEWWIAVLFAPEMAESFNGQQGDAFDPQKDMALATLGAAIGAAAALAWERGPVSSTRRSSAGPL